MSRPPLRLLPVVTPLDPERWAEALKEEARTWLRHTGFRRGQGTPQTRLGVWDQDGVRIVRLELDLSRPAREVWALVSDPAREAEWRGAQFSGERLERRGGPAGLEIWKVQLRDLPSPFAPREQVRLHAAWPEERLVVARSVLDRRATRQPGVVRGELCMWVARIDEDDPIHSRLTLLWAARDGLPGWLTRWLAVGRARRLAAAFRACVERLPR